MLPFSFSGLSPGKLGSSAYFTSNPDHPIIKMALQSYTDARRLSVSSETAYRSLRDLTSLRYCSCPLQPRASFDTQYMVNTGLELKLPFLVVVLCSPSAVCWKEFEAGE